MKQIRRIKIPFHNQMTKLQTLLGWIYVPLHILILPLLLNLYAEFSPNQMTLAQYNLLYYAAGTIFVLCVMLRFLRRDFDVLLDNLRLCLLCVVFALMIDYALSTVSSLLLLLLEPELENPNNAAVMELAEGNYGVVKALAIFIAPLVEEMLFRGVVFGSIRTRNRGWAYVVSALLFAVYHVWQYAVQGQDLSLLLYALQYIPISVVLAWLYERSGSLWMSIFFHMGFNALNFYVMNLLEML